MSATIENMAAFTSFPRPLRTIGMPGNQKLSNWTNESYDQNTTQKEAYWEATNNLNNNSSSRTQHQQLLAKMS